MTAPIGLAAGAMMTALHRNQVCDVVVLCEHRERELRCALALDGDDVPMFRELHTVRRRKARLIEALRTGATP